MIKQVNSSQSENDSSADDDSQDNNLGSGMTKAQEKEFYAELEKKLRSKPPMVVGKHSGKKGKKSGGFLPGKVELTEDQKQYSKQSKNFSNLIDLVMTPRQLDVSTRGIFAEIEHLNKLKQLKNQIDQQKAYQSYTNSSSLQSIVTVNTNTTNHNNHLPQMMPQSSKQTLLNDYPLFQVELNTDQTQLSQLQSKKKKKKKKPQNNFIDYFPVEDQVIEEINEKENAKLAMEIINNNRDKSSVVSQGQGEGRSFIAKDEIGKNGGKSIINSVVGGKQSQILHLKNKKSFVSDGSTSEKKQQKGVEEKKQRKMQEQPLTQKVDDQQTYKQLFYRQEEASEQEESKFSIDQSTGQYTQGSQQRASKSKKKKKKKN